MRRPIAAAAIAWLSLLTAASAGAEWLANSKPIYLSFAGSAYWPALFEYAPAQFGRADLVRMDYRALPLAQGDVAIWPPIRWDPYERNANVAHYPSPPSRENWLGTDDRGRDVAARLIYGYRYAMGYALLVWAIVSFLGAASGSAMGFLGGRADLIGQRLIEVFESIPALLLLIALIAIFDPQMWLLAAFSGLFGWAIVCQFFRAEFLRLRKQEFTDAARAIGCSRTRIVIRHLLPNSLTPWLTMSPFLIAGYVGQLVALDYLGFGLRAPTPSWGELLAQAQANFSFAWWLAVYPSALIFFVLGAMNALGGAARARLDPRSAS